MKTLIKILRSIITSFLFIILTFAMTVQFTFTCFKLSGNKIPDLINRKEIMNIVTKSEELPKEVENSIIEYIDNYINYVFYKRSFPSLEILNKEDLNEEDIAKITNLTKDIRDKIDINYESVLKIRNINNILSNGSIYLLINIGIFVILIILFIINMNCKKTIMAFGLSSILSGLISILSSTILVKELSKIVDYKIYNFINSIFSDSFMTSFYDQGIIYICLGLVVFLITYLISKFVLSHKTTK